MSFLGFGANYNRPGPGIPKDAPEKKGAALFFDILGREFWSLLTLNFIYILACLPIITIGPATAALSRVTVTMVRDKNVYPWRDFWEAFRKNIKQGILFGIPTTLFVAVALWINFGFFFAIADGSAGIFQMALLFLWTFLGVSVGCYIYPLIAYVNLPSFSLLKNSLLLVVLGKFRSIGAVFASIAAAALFLLFLPYSTIVVLFLGFFSLLSFFTSFMVWPVIQQFVIRDENSLPQVEESESGEVTEPSEETVK